jgi:UDP-N-acetylmuramoyl-tripeptide--D-alanyl-D-alanine ligase (EC 6.3.2.10)
VVVELGTNRPGEIAELCRIAEPTHGVITAIAEEHLELLGSLDGVEQEETALFRWLGNHGGIACINRDDERGTELEFVIMVIAVSCVKLLSAHNSTQHTSRKHKV